MPLAARTVLVTGASRGLGLTFVKQLIKLPSPPEVIIATCRNPSGASELQALSQANSSVKVVKLDVEKDEDIEECVKTTTSAVGEKGLSLLINNSGIFEPVGTKSRDVDVSKGKDDHEKGHLTVTKLFGGSLEDQSRALMQKHFNVNVTSPIILVQKLLPLLKKAAAQKSSDPLSCSRAGVVNISALLASQDFTQNYRGGVSLHYKCSKTALNMATIMLDHELRDAGILVTSIHPGWVKTDMGTDLGHMTADESIAACLDTMAKADVKSAGKMLNFDGNVLTF
ncbi:uncharacterized oxidoreductase C663.06c [Aplysia californica]|uniref:Uncharacterized oxidoreductase C663.06c n=1 Tax=Aplysia californica TaxID=6500 RepID=A0ABM0JN51_APLCA|nr:uncharacterized oxidoreductase C663.06c [Aplysia californica]